jgi:hypothetical protein
VILKSHERQPALEELCRQATVEQDPERLLELVKEIDNDRTLLSG